MVCSLITALFVSSIKFNKLSSRFDTENEILETVWTILPGVILLFLALPSLVVLYSIEEVLAPSVTLKITGHQWYWSYDYSDTAVSLDSFIEKRNSQFRLLEVDNRVPLPWGRPVRLIVSSEDVIHSWTIPSMGNKIDAVPGRINIRHMFSLKAGTFYGQCSEICGVNHSFMPVVVEFTSPLFFKKWVREI